MPSQHASAIGVQITPRSWYRHYDRYNYGNDWKYGKPSDYDAYYNFKIGEMTLGLTGRMAAEWSDNNNRASDAGNEEEGWSMIPELTLAVRYPVSPAITINFSLSAGYRYYTNDEAGESDFFLSGDTGVAAAETGATIILGEDHYINIHDRLTFESQTLSAETYYTDPNDDDSTMDSDSWRNTLDFTYGRQLHPDWSTNLTYAYENRWATTDEYDYLDFAKHSFDWSLRWHVIRNIHIGPYYTWSMYDFDTDERNDRTTNEFGINADISDAFGLEGLSISMNGGYEILNSSSNETADDEDDGFTANFTTRYEPEGIYGHRVRTSFRRNHEDPNPSVNYADELLLGYGLDIKATQELIFTADVDWMDINESDSGERFNMIRFWITGTYWLAPQTSCDLS